MNKLTLDQIGFIKRKIEQFIVLPESPRKESSPQTPNPRKVDNLKNNVKRSSSNQKQTGNLPKKNNVVRQRSVSGDKKNTSQRKSGNVALSPQNKRQIQSSSQSKNWLKKKESEIVKFINHENRNKQSVLNKFLNSEKLHLKKREEVDEKYAHQKQNQHRDETEENGASKSFSFDNEFTSLKKVYKNLGSLFALNEVQEYKQSTPNNDLMISKEDKSDNNHESADPSKNRAGLFDFLKHFSGQKQPSKQTYVVQTGQSLVKPSALKGKIFQGKKQEAGKSNSMVQSKNQGKPANLFQLFGKGKEVAQEEGTMQSGIKEKEVAKSRSQVSLDRMKMSGSASIGKNAKGQIKEKERHNSISRKERLMKGTSNSQSKNSFEPYFDSERPSSIRQKRHMNSNQDMSQQKSRFVNEEFPYWVYRRSAKENAYEMTKEQKYYRNKYSTKQMVEGDSDKTVLKQKYDLLDQRLQKLLESVKRQDQPSVKPHSSQDQSYISVVNQARCEVPQQILTYQRLSPLKKLVKINNQLKLKFNSSAS